MKKYIFTTMLLCLCMVQASAASTDGMYDFTSLVQNAACQNAPGWLHHSGEAAGSAGTNYCKNNADFHSATYSGAGIETWSSTAYNDNRFLIYQDLNNLPAGNYVLTAYVAAMDYDTGSWKGLGTNNGGIYLCAGNGETEFTNAKWAEVQVEFTVADPTTPVRIGIKAGASNSNEWAVISNVHLYASSLVAEDIALNETYTTYPVRHDCYARVLWHQYIPSDRFTVICLPFELSEEAVTANFAVAKRLTGASKSGDNVAVTSEAVTSMEAGQVYIVKGAAERPEVVTIEGVKVLGQQPAAQALGEFTLQGVYRQYETLEDVYLLNAEGTAFIKAAGFSKINGFSAYIR